MSGFYVDQSINRFAFGIYAKSVWGYVKWGNMAPGCCQTSVAKYTANDGSNNFSNKKCYSAISVVLTHMTHTLNVSNKRSRFPRCFSFGHIWIKALIWLQQGILPAWVIKTTRHDLMRLPLSLLYRWHCLLCKRSRRKTWRTVSHLC